jgi:hypothetical protein
MCVYIYMYIYTHIVNSDTNFNQEYVNIMLSIITISLYLQLLLYIFNIVYAKIGYYIFPCIEVSMRMAIYRWNMSGGCFMSMCNL